MYWIALQALPDAVVAGDAPGNAPEPFGSAALAPADATAALGWWALQFTPRVAQAGPAVLLEVSASERLFGGRELLLAHIMAADKPLAQIRHAQASTSLIALALLQTGTEHTSAPDRLPLATLAEAQPHLPTLERIGCRLWGDLRALPRGGVARRFGAPLLDALDRAYGLKPEVYPWLLLPEVFDMPLELSAQVEAAPALLFAARRLLGQLQAWLRARRQGILALELGWQMDARRNTASHGQLLLRTAEATLDMQHLQRLLGEHLGRITLPAPVLSLRMRSIETAQLPGESASLLPDELRAGDSLHQLLERLAARLGPEQVLRALPRADHRPEQMQSWLTASAVHPPDNAAAAGKKRKPRGGAAGATPAWAEFYPTWLLATPLKLAVRQDRPLYQGPLTLLVGPQRLEAAWWGSGATGHHAATLRDYFLARSEQAGLLWIYRERLLVSQAADAQQVAGHWYLHGLYG
ncbi:MAG: DNA polymerase Y family protein [Rhodoferax sp.]|nr:DNA polymerase Y family protein [Rhodoferax sp.]